MLLDSPVGQGDCRVEFTLRISSASMWPTARNSHQTNEEQDFFRLGAVGLARVGLSGGPATPPRQNKNNGGRAGGPHTTPAIKKKLLRLGMLVTTRFLLSHRLDLYRGRVAEPGGLPGLAGKSALGVRRDKAALSSGCKSHPAIAPAGSSRSSYGGDEIAEAFGMRVTNS